MILQALVHHYEQLLKRGELEAPGWSPVKVSYLLELEDSGTILSVICVKDSEQRGKKLVMIPKAMSLPTPVKRSSGIAANFLADNSSYLLGIDNKGKPQRALECFAACKALHHQLLDGLDHPAAKALLNYFDTWDPSHAENNRLFSEDADDLFSGANLTFYYRGKFLHEIDDIRQAWSAHYGNAGESTRGFCLVTGRQDNLALLHPSIKGVAGAQSSGASLVSFNAPAFCSYGKEQGMNAPTGSYAAFAYGAALNDLLSKQRLRMGDTTLLLWADNAEPAYTEVMARAMDINAFFLQERNYDERDLMDALNELAKGHSVEFDSQRLDPNMTFYILGLAPNAARLSVRFFLRNSFGNFVKNVMAHHQRMEIVRPKFENIPTVSLKSMLEETVNQKAKDKSPKPGLAGEVLRAILNDTRYPASLLHGVHLRIRADHELNRSRAAIIKAYYLKNQVAEVPKEVLTVSLNPDASNTAYQLGRLFALLEEIQENASEGKLNTTIKDRYFSSASATPSVVFPTLMNLAQNHLTRLRKKHPDQFINYSKQLEKIMEKLDESYPTQQTLPQQGSFQIGYYHQTQYRYTKKEDK